MIEYSQRDPQWSSERLGFASDDMTIGNSGCLLTAAATVLSNYGFVVNPSELNEKLRSIGGFTGGLMYFNSLAQLYGVRVQLKSRLENLDELNSKIDAGYFVIVELDSSPVPGFQNHWVVLYKRDGTTYFMSDPWYSKPDPTPLVLNIKYGFTGHDPLAIINQVLFVEAIATVPAVKPKPRRDISSGDKVRVVVDGLRLRSTPSTKPQPVSMLVKGTELVVCGEAIEAEGIKWQPVVFYVAESYNNVVYLEAPG